MTHIKNREIKVRLPNTLILTCGPTAPCQLVAVVPAGAQYGVTRVIQCPLLANSGHPGVAA